MKSSKHKLDTQPSGDIAKSSATSVAIAALSATEALAIAMLEAGRMDPDDLLTSLDAAAQAHRNAASDGGPSIHAEIADTLDRVVHRFENTSKFRKPATGSK